MNKIEKIKLIKNSVIADGGPRKFSGALVCRITFKQLFQPLEVISKAKHFLFEIIKNIFGVTKTKSSRQGKDKIY
jgi:hypothetical protein